MNKILDPTNKTEESKDKVPPAKPKIPLPQEGEVLLAAYVNSVNDNDDPSKQRHVTLRFEAHAALSPMELLSILNEFARTLQAAAQKQMSNAIAVASPEEIAQLGLTKNP